MNENKETKQTPKAVERVALIRQALSVVKQDYSGECSQMATRREYVEDAVSQMIDAGYRVTQNQAPAVEAALRPFAKAYEDWNGGNAREYFASAVVPAHFRAAALALARASEAAEVPAGYKLVPAEPTVEMLNAALPHDVTFGHGFKRRIHQEMIAAAPQPANEPVDEGCTPADARMLRAANHGLADENAMLRRRLRPFAALANPRLSWAMVEYCIDGDPEKQTLQAPQMQRAFNRAAEALADELPSHEPADCDALDLPDWIKNAKPPVPEQPANEPAERVPPYDGLLEEFVDEVARLCNDAPGSRNAVYSALQHCNVNIIPADQPASEQQAARGPNIGARQRITMAVESYWGVSSEEAVELRSILAAKGDGHE